MNNNRRSIRGAIGYQFLTMLLLMCSMISLGNGAEEFSIAYACGAILTGVIAFLEAS